MPPKPSGPVSRITSAGKCAVPVPFQRIGRYVIGGEGLGHVLDGALILGELELADAASTAASMASP